MEHTQANGQLSMSTTAGTLLLFLSRRSKRLPGPVFQGMSTTLLVIYPTAANNFSLSVRFAWLCGYGCSRYVRACTSSLHDPAPGARELGKSWGGGRGGWRARRRTTKGMWDAPAWNQVSMLTMHACRPLGRVCITTTTTFNETRKKYGITEKKCASAVTKVINNCSVLRCMQVGLVLALQHTNQPT